MEMLLLASPFFFASQSEKAVRSSGRIGDSSRMGHSASLG
jgi:hypothetical protein